MKKILLFLCLFVIFLFYGISPVRAENNQSFPSIIIINLVRGNGLGHEHDDLVSSLKAQWQVTKQSNVQATWLFQYGALENKEMSDFAKKEMKDQDFGLLFEIDRDYANQSNVQYRGQGPWYFSDGLLLVSYDQGERRKLIDMAFSKFKNVFGYYPKTVGAWWIGGDSLTYMQKKYGITAVLRAADQFNLDTYSIWGTPWDIPYLSSEKNQGMPADSYDESSKVVNLQWAVRDPVRGYDDPTFSLQDYGMKGYTTDYVDYLASIYLQKPFGNFVMGLENGGSLEYFQQAYKTMLTKAKELEVTGQAHIVLAKDYAESYLQTNRVFAGKTYFLSTDYASDDQVFWYMSENYRFTIQKIKDTIYVVDVRNYADKTEEDFSELPNSSGMLRINEPEIIDAAQNPNQKILIQKSTYPLTVKQTGNTIGLFAAGEQIASFSPNSATVYLENNAKKTFSFIPNKPIVSPFAILLVLYSAYLITLLVTQKNYRKTIKTFSLLLIPLLLAYPYLTQTTTFLIDKKESVVFSAVLLFHSFSILTATYITKIVPLVALLVLYYLCIIRFPKKLSFILFSVYYYLIVLLYAHVPYFPLDKSTYSFVFQFFIVVTILLVSLGIVIYNKTECKNKLLISLLLPIAILSILAIAVVVSRSELAITPYELQAMQFIRSQHKNVIFVEQIDYSVKPIYKAVRPVLYNNYSLGQRMTNSKWEVTMRPENNILNISNYDNKFIVIPRYFGSDISDYEINLLKLRKIFDNTQIAIFEKSI